MVGLGTHDRRNFGSDGAENLPLAVEKQGNVGVLKITNVSGGSVTNRSTFSTGEIWIPTAGTAVQGPNVSVPNGFGVVFKANDSLSGGATMLNKIYLKKASTAANNFYLFATQEAKLYLSNLNLVWIDADSNGAILKWIVEQ